MYDTIAMYVIIISRVCTSSKLIVPGSEYVFFFYKVT